MFGGDILLNKGKLVLLKYFISVLHADHVKCYKCTPDQSWCSQEDEIKDRGEEFQTDCDSNSCLVSGNKIDYIPHRIDNFDCTEYSN